MTFQRTFEADDHEKWFDRCLNLINPHTLIPYPTRLYNSMNFREPSQKIKYLFIYHDRRPEHNLISDDRVFILCPLLIPSPTQEKRDESCYVEGPSFNSRPHPNHICSRSFPSAQ